MSIKLYDLAGAEDERRFSPFCWRIKMALAHKSLPVEDLPWRFTEKEAIGFTEQGRVPVIVDEGNGGKAIWDSWAIAEYLDETYPKNLLFTEQSGKAATYFVKSWVERVVHPGVVKQVLVDIYDHLHEKDKDYFRTSREKIFGMALEDVVAPADENLPVFRASLAPMRAVVERFDFMGGDSPAFADYIAFGPFAWARAISGRPLLEAEDPIYAWRERMLDLYNGYARSAPGYDY